MTAKQLCDLISVAFVAITSERDTTVLEKTPLGTFPSPLHMEIRNIFKENIECSEIDALVNHITAIRTGFKQC